MCVLREVCVHNFHSILEPPLSPDPAVQHRNHVIQRPSSFAPVVKDNSRREDLWGK